MPLTVRRFDSKDLRPWGELAARPADGTGTYYAVSYPEYLEFTLGNGFYGEDTRLELFP
jgi:hypothetical protein